MGRQELIDNLNKALACELAGVIQYSQHSYLVTGTDREVFKGFSVTRPKRLRTTQRCSATRSLHSAACRPLSPR